MEKYLFSDGTNVVREVQSDQELQELIRSAGDTDKIRIWAFNSSEWITYPEYSKRVGPKSSPARVISNNDAPKPVPVIKKKTGNRFSIITKLLALAVTVFAIFMVYNFTRIKWVKAPTLEITASRPANVPLLNIDSLIWEIENSRGQKLDKVTSTNLRIRNSWPDRIQLQLKSERDSSLEGSRYHHVALTIDNSTGYQVDQAIVELKCWKNNEVNKLDTFHFHQLGYSTPATREIPGEYRGDSLSVSFISVRSKGFNFCYAAGKESNYGNLNDRWFCRE